MCIVISFKYSTYVANNCIEVCHLTKGTKSFLNQSTQKYLGVTQQTVNMQDETSETLLKYIQHLNELSIFIILGFDLF